MKNIKNKIVLITVFLNITLLASAEESFKDFTNEMQEYVQEQKEEYGQYSKELEEEFQKYTQIMQEEMKKFEKEILNYWEKPDMSDKTKWVEYSDDFTTKKIVDFENKTMKIEIIVDEKEKNKEEKIKEAMKNLILEDKKEAFKNDKVAQNVEKKVAVEIKNIKTDEVKEEPIVLPMFTDKEKYEKATKEEKEVIAQNITDKLVKEKEIKEKPSKVENKKIISIEVPLPQDGISKKAEQFREYVEKYSKEFKIQKELIYAVMHSESSFNPMAKSPIPAYGLMQIVPKSAGQDVMKRFYGKQELPAPSYLYNSENNIKTGTAYLNILYYNYLKSIKDEQSKFLCTIAAYNTGAGNVARAFTGRTKISEAAEKINTMTPVNVYKTLKKNLPYDETKRYVDKVYGRTKIYRNF